MAEPKYRTIRIPKPRSRGIRGKMALQRWQRSGGRQKQILNPKTGKYERVLFGDAGQRQLQKLYPTDKGAAAEEKRGKLKKEQADRNIAGAAEAKKKAAEISAKGKKDREAKAKAKADAEAKAKADAEAEAKRAAAKPEPDPPPLPKPAPVAKAKPKLARPTATRGRGEPDLPLPPVDLPKTPAVTAEPPPPPKRIVPKAQATAPTVAAKAPPTRGALTRGEPEPPKIAPPVRITEEAPKSPASSSNLADLPELDQVKLNAVLKDLKNKVLSPDFKTPTQSEIAEAVTKATGGRYTPPVAKVAEPEPPKAEPVAVAPKAAQELAMPTVIDIPGGGQIEVPKFKYKAAMPDEGPKEIPQEAIDALAGGIFDSGSPRPAVTKVPTPQAVLDANKAAGSPVADVLAIANAKKIGGDLNADQIRSLINEGKMDPDDDFFIDKEGIFGEPGLRYNKGVPETVVDQIVQDRQQAAAAAQQASGQTGPIFSVPDPQAKPLEEIAQQPTAPVVSAPTPEPTPEPAPSAPPPPQFVNMDPMQGFRETYIPTNVLGQSYDPSVRDAYTQKMMQAGANIQQGGYPMFKTPTSAIPQTQFGGYGAPMPIAPLMPYAGLAAPQPPQMASGAIVNPGTGAPMPVGMAPPPRIPGT